MVPFRCAALEVFQGSAAIIEFSDVWSYGVFMWEMFYLDLDFLQKCHRLKKPHMCPKYIYVRFDA